MKENIYHNLNRGVEKRVIFSDTKDYMRFIYNLRDFNDVNNINLHYNERHQLPDVARRRTKLIDSLCWVLMPNHYHILVQEKLDKGISKFSKKIVGGYTKYFNFRNERSGVLFQGRSKIILIKNNNHFRYLPFYIFSNPIKLIDPKWKENGIKDFKRVKEFLENYKYSSLPDIMGKNNFSDIFNKKLFYEVYDTNEVKFKKDFIEWLREHQLPDVRRREVDEK